MRLALFGKDDSSFAGDVASTTVARIWWLVVSFVGGIITARILLPEGKGIYASILVIPSIIASIGNLGVRQSATYLVGKKHAEPGDVLPSMLNIWLAASSAALVVVVAGFLAQRLEVHGWAILGAAAASVPLTLYVSYLNGLAMGKRWIGKVNLGEIVRATGQVVLVIALVWMLRMGVLGAFLAYSGALLLQAVYLSFLASSFGARSVPRPEGLSGRLVRTGLGFAAALFVIQLNYRVDIMILHRLVDSTEVGLYSVAVALSEMVWQVPTILGFVIFAHSATAPDAAEFSRRNLALLRRIMPAMVIVGALVAALAPVFVPAFYGEAFRPSVRVIWILLPGIVALVPARLAHGDLAGRGDPMTGLKVFSLSLVLNVVLNLLWIPRFGIMGAGLATTVSYAVATLIFVPLYLRASADEGAQGKR